MGPLEGIGPYAETTITTRKSDANGAADKKGHFGHLVVWLLILGPTMWVTGFMGLFVSAHIGLIVPAGIIGLALWACVHYGTNDSLWARITYRTTAAQRETVQRRLSDIENF